MRPSDFNFKSSILSDNMNMQLKVLPITINLINSDTGGLNHPIPSCNADRSWSVRIDNTEYLTRDYYNGFIYDWEKVVSGKIWRNPPKPTKLSRSWIYQWPTFHFQNWKLQTWCLWLVKFYKSRLSQFVLLIAVIWNRSKIIDHWW